MTTTQVTEHVTTKTNNIRHSSASVRWGTGTEYIDVIRKVLGRIYVDPFSEEEFNVNIEAMRFLDGTPGRDGFKDRWIASDLAPRADHLLSRVYTPVAPAKFFAMDPIRVARGDLPSVCQAEENRVVPTAHVNAPGSGDGENVKNAYAILESYWRLGWLNGGASYVAFSLNQFQTLQFVEENGGFSPLSPMFEGMRCVPSKRKAFIAHSSRPDTRIDKHGKEVENDDAPSHPSFLLIMPSRDPIVAAEQRRVFEIEAGKLGDVF